MSLAYYNEIDAFAAAWLQQLIAAGHIAPGVVDTRSIEDVTPDELAGFTQCHFFAGIGVWSYALRQAGWRDDQPVWTGSCPCQPFSAAGKGGGFADERHLWPGFLHLIQQCGPTVVLGEQVASKDGLAWLDLVRSDLEGTGRSFAAADLCAAGVGAPHIRQRSFWVAHTLDDGQRQYGQGVGRTPRTGESELPERAQRVRADTAHGSAAIGLGDDDDTRLEGHDRNGDHWGQPRWVGTQSVGSGGPTGGSGGLADADGRDACAEWQQRRGEQRQQPQDDRLGDNRSAGPTNGFWRDADWLFCRDGKWRPVESGTFPLVNGTSNRVGRLRGYGNAIVAPVAQVFIESVMDALCD